MIADLFEPGADIVPWFCDGDPVVITQGDYTGMPARVSHVNGWCERRGQYTYQLALPNLDGEITVPENDIEKS
jgi:hypothetical protein